MFEIFIKNYIFCKCHKQIDKFIINTIICFTNNYYKFGQIYTIINLVAKLKKIS